MKKIIQTNWRYHLIIALLLASQAIYGQQECGTQISSPQEAAQLRSNHLQYLNNQALLSPTTANKWIPVVFHIVRQTAGTGGISLTDARLALERCNNAYSGTNIRFYECGWENIDSDTYYTFNEATEEAGLVSTRLTAGAANIFIVDDINSGSACGYANFSTTSNPGYGNNFILMDRSCMDNANQTSLQHEFGHFFDIFHTHETAFGNELVTRGAGANCTSAGDQFCDTPADPILTGVVNSSCQYTGTATDANGQAYNPDPTNIMSYSVKPCRTYFSSEQIAKMNYTVSDLGPSNRNSLSCQNCIPYTLAVPLNNSGTYQMGEYYTYGDYINGKWVLQDMSSNVDLSAAAVNGSSLSLIATNSISFTPGFSFDAATAQLTELTAIADACGGTGNKLLNSVNSQIEKAGLSHNNFVRSYPNPFSNKINIEISLAEDAQLSVVIYDLLGKEVDIVLQNQIKQKGVVQLQYRNEKLQPGIYFCSIEINDKRYTEKIVKL